MFLCNLPFYLVVVYFISVSFILSCPLSFLWNFRNCNHQFFLIMLICISTELVYISVLIPSPAVSIFLYREFHNLLSSIIILFLFMILTNLSPNPKFLNSLFPGNRLGFFFLLFYPCEMLSGTRVMDF